MPSSLSSSLSKESRWTISPSSTLVSQVPQTPSAQLVVQGSVDGSTWIDVVLGTARTTPGIYREVLDGNVALLPWVRVRLVLAGTTPPSVDASVEVVSTGGFTLASS